jgi:hypothetical protein
VRCRNEKYMEYKKERRYIRYKRKRIKRDGKENYKEGRWMKRREIKM